MDTAIVDKIRKLLALSKSDNEHEAKLAMQRANELMAKYQIASVDILLEDTKVNKVTGERYTVEGQRMKLIWIICLAQASAKLFDGDVIKDGTLHGTSFTFVGTPDDLPLMKAMFEHLYQAWFGIVDVDLSKAKMLGRFTPADTMKFKAGHGIAYAMALLNRVGQLLAERKRALAEVQNGMALVVSKQNNLNDYVSGNSRTRKQKMSRGSQLGNSYGHSAGNSVPLGGAISGHQHQLKG